MKIEEDLLRWAKDHLRVAKPLVERHPGTFMYFAVSIEKDLLWWARDLLRMAKTFLERLKFPSLAG